MRTDIGSFPIQFLQEVLSGCCDFLAQCILVRINHCTYHPFYSPKSSKIYRCWIVWGRNIRVVIIPSFLAVAYLGRSIYPCLIIRFQFTVSSYLGIAIFGHFLAILARDPQAAYIKSRCDYGRECPDDGLDSVQDPRGVLGG